MKNNLLAVIITFLCIGVVKGQITVTPDLDTKTIDPRITAVLQHFNKDSIAANIRQLVNFDTRYEFAPNRKEISEWIRQKFLSFGYTDAFLDSFKLVNPYPPKDTTWQYNVISTLSGNSAPEEVYILCAHHDSYASPDPELYSPGADDNASGTASLMEFARVLKKQNFLPAATIRFLTIAGEELMGATQYSGANNYVDKALSNHEDIRLVIDLDVIAYNPPENNLIQIPFSEGETSEWTFNLVSSAISSYTDLETHAIPGGYSGNTESFMIAGYAFSYFMEYNLNPYMHTIHDIIDSCNMDYCTEVIKATGAALLIEQFNPVPQGLTDKSMVDRIRLSWKPTDNANHLGNNVYRSSEPDSGYILLNQTVLSDTMYIDTAVTVGQFYYYRVTGVDQNHSESAPSNTIKSSLFPKDKNLLVIKDSKGGMNSPTDEQVIGFYNYIFCDLVHDFINASDTDTINQNILGRYRNLIWLSNTYSNQLSAYVSHRGEVTKYLKNGGNLFLVNFQPSYLVEDNLQIKKKFSKGTDFYDYFKISDVNRGIYGMLSGAYPISTGYDSLYVDSTKGLSSFPRHIKNLETFTEAPGGKVIYLFDSEYDTSTVYGEMKGKPVGVEYLGDDYKVITMSVPLYYIDSLQARNLVEFIVNEKFKPGVGIDERSITSQEIMLYQNYPNPVIEETVIRYFVNEPTTLTLEVRNLYGQRVAFYSEGRRDKGIYEKRVNMTGLPGGLYYYLLKSENEFHTGKMILLH